MPPALRPPPSPLLDRGPIAEDEAALRRDDNLIATRPQRSPEHVFAGATPIGVCGVEHGHAEVDGCLNQFDIGSDRPSTAAAKSDTAEPDSQLDLSGRGEWPSSKGINASASRGAFSG